MTVASPVVLPDADSPDLQLSHPTPQECIEIWSHTATSWRDSLTLRLYVEEAQYLATVPLAKDGGMSTWILVDKNLPPNERQIFCSCETFRKRSLASNECGNIADGIVYGVASVFTPPKYRRRGYGTRHMKELAKALVGWQSEYGQSIGSVLYSDIGKEYYAKVGWLPNLRNSHFVLQSVPMHKPSLVQPIFESGLEALCLRDEAILRKAMAAPSTRRKRVTILPDLDHMLWHVRKEDFAVKYIFGKTAEAKGAIAGSPGKQVWAIWVRRYYSHPNHLEEGQEDGNVLYILRLVVEGDDTANQPYDDQLPPTTDAYTDQAAALKAVMQAAQAEAAKWCLSQVQLWEPSPLIQKLLKQSGLPALHVERQKHSIASVLWFEEEHDGVEEAPCWVNNEYYAWC
ncbi:hypothetical protein F5Y08DRAFT_142479 [Xylaria arbuscula]|nr:hypothetical protein F5Y08DRAFT_142479 [Xylaria arbuscula]